MPSFYYLADGPQGEQVSGTIDAPDLAEAERSLIARGLTPRELRPADVPSSRETLPTPRPRREALSTGEAQELAEQLAEISGSRLPLPAGLRAAAAECDNRRLAAALSRLAEDIEAGRSLDDALATHAGALPAQFLAIVRGAARTDDFGGVLAEMLEQHQATRDRERALRAVFAYPALVLALLVMILVVFSFILIPQFEWLIVEMEVDVPPNTRVAFWMARYGVWLLVAAVVLFALLPPILVSLLGRQRWNSLVATLPLVGPARRWSSVVELARLAAIFVRQGLPLPDVLRLAGEANSDAVLADACDDLAADVEAGKPLGEAVFDDGRLPPSIVPHLHWGQRTGALAEAFDAVCDLFQQRVELRTAWLKAVLPPLVFATGGLAIVSLLSGLVMPLVELISKLS
jgi:type II secretory pathway component PulF